MGSCRPGKCFGHFLKCHGVSLEKDGLTDTTWMSLEDVTLSEISPSQGRHCVIPLTGGPWKSQIHRDRKEMVGARGGGRGWECFMGAECQFGKMRKSWRQTVGMAARQREWP